MKKVLGVVLSVVGGVIAVACVPFLLHALINAFFVLALGQPVPDWWWRLIAPVQNIVTLPILAFAFVIKVGPTNSLLLPVVLCVLVQAIGVVLLWLGLRTIRRAGGRVPPRGGAALSALLLVLALIGCRAAPAGESGVVAPPGGVVVQWSTWGGSENVALQDEIIRGFEADHPGIKIQRVTVANFTDYLTKLQTLLASGSPPDVVSLGNEWFPAFMDKGAFQPLTSYIEADPELDLDDWLPVTLEVLTRNGELYALPADFSVDALYYNLDAFDAAGVSYPDGSWTWDTLLDAAQRLTERDAGGRVVRYGWSDTGLNMWPWIWQHGGTIFDNEREPTKATLTDPAVVEAVQFYYDLSLTHKVAPNVAELQQTPLREMFMAGRVAMIYDNVGAQVPFAQITDFRWDVAMLAQGKERATPMAENGYAMSASTDHPEAAWALIRYLSGPEAVRVIVGAGGALPALTALAESDEFEVRPAFLASLPYAKPIFSAPQMLDMLAVFRSEQPLMAMGLKPVPEALRSMNALFNEMLGAE